MRRSRNRSRRSPTVLGTRPRVESCQRPGRRLGSRNAPRARYGSTSVAAGSAERCRPRAARPPSRSSRPRATPAAPTRQSPPAGANVCPPPTDVAESGRPAVRRWADAAGRDRCRRIDDADGHRPGARHGNARQRGGGGRATRTSRSSTARRSAARTEGSSSRATQELGHDRHRGVPDRHRARPADVDGYLVSDADRVPGHRHVAGGNDHDGWRPSTGPSTGNVSVLERRRLHVLAANSASLNNLTSSVRPALPRSPGEQRGHDVSVNAGSTAAQAGTQSDEPQRLAAHRRRFERRRRSRPRCTTSSRSTG